MTIRGEVVRPARSGWAAIGRPSLRQLFAVQRVIITRTGRLFGNLLRLGAPEYSSISRGLCLRVATRLGLAC